MNPSERRQVLAGWLLHFGILVALYTAAAIGAIWALHTLPPNSLRTLLVMLPILPGLALLWQSVRSYRRSDEFIRQRIVQAVAVTALWTAAWTLIYAWLEPLGLPRLSVGFVHNFGWPVFVWQMVRLMRSA